MIKKPADIYSRIVFIFLLIIGIYSVPIRIMGWDLSMIPGDLGDARFNNYILEHGYQFISGQIKTYWDAPFMYPTKNVVAFSDNLLGTLPIYSVFRFSGFDRETSFQLWFLMLHILNYFFCYLALNKWFKSPLLASIAAYIFAFGIFNIGQIYHVQVFPRFMIPLLFYWCWKFLKLKELKYFVYLCIGTVYQFYCGIYLGFFSLYAFLFLLLAYLIVYRDWELFKQFKSPWKSLGMFGGILISVFLLLPLLYPYIEASGKMGMRQFHEIFNSIPHLSSYFFSHPTSVIWLDLLYHHGPKSIEEWWLHMIFPGILPWLAVFISPLLFLDKSLKKENKKFLLFILLAFFLSMIFCMNFETFNLYWIIFELPGFSSMRAVNRIINVQIIFFIILLIYFFKVLQKRYAWARGLLYALPFIVILDNAFRVNADIIRYEKNEGIAKVETIKKKIISEHDVQYEAIAYALEEEDKKSHRSVIQHHISVMLACQDLNIKCVNAYTGSYPPNYMPFFDLTNKETLSAWCEYNQIDMRSIQFINL